MRVSSFACNGFLRFTSDATPANLLKASISAGFVPVRGKMPGFDQETPPPPVQ